jgi:hypothetical protein
VQDTLQSLGEVAVTLVGFAALFRVFTRESVADEHSETRLQVIIEQGLGVVLLCFLPAWLLSFGDVSPQAAYRSISVGAALWQSRWVYIAYSIRSLKQSTPVGFRFAVVLQIGSFVTFAACAAGLLGWVEPLYLTGLLVTFTHVGWAFLFQFRVERS